MAGSRWQRLLLDCTFVSELVDQLVQEIELPPTAGVRANLNESIARLQGAFGRSSDLVVHRFRLGTPARSAAIVYLDGMADARIVNQDILGALQRPEADGWLRGGFHDAPPLAAGNVRATTETTELIAAVLAGDVALLVDGEARAWAVESKGYQSRRPEEPTTEQNVLGSKEAFVEPLRTNTTMVRRRVKNRNLRVVQLSIGSLSPTTVAVVYLDGIANAKTVQALLTQLQVIEADSIRSSAQLSALLCVGPRSPLPQLERTERPESVANAVLAGRIAVLVENDPFAILAPTTLWDMLQSLDEFNQSAWGATFLRVMRAMALLSSVLLPGIYVAFVMIHLQVLPTDLSLSILSSRQGVPFPAPLEYALLIFVFETLREVSIRIPKTMGPTIGVVGGIVLGQAIVRTGVVSAPLIVVVSLVGLSLFTPPRFQMINGLRYMAITSLLFGSVFGLYGIMIAGIMATIHLNTLGCFGIPYLKAETPDAHTPLHLVIRRSFGSLARAASRRLSAS